MAVYDTGDVIRLSASFTNASNVLADPGAVYLKYKRPDATTASFTYGSGSLFQLDVGIYYYDLQVPSGASGEGVWYYRFWSASPGQAAAEAYLRVQPTRV